MARLIIFDESMRGVDLPDRAVIVGRSLKADVPIHDRLLSRKHCTLVPEGDGYRFLDLKSANGSYVNGVRVEKTELEYDDIIEIGNTVMVFLESDTWERGEGLAKLRNPIKAQALIGRIKRGAAKGPDGGDPGLDAIVRDRQGGDLQWTKGLLEDPALTPEFLEGFLTNRIVSVLVRRTPELRECLSDALERVLTPESFQGGFEHFRSLVREAIRTSLAEVGLGGAPTESRSGEATAPDPTPREAPGRAASAQPSSAAAAEDEAL